MNTPVVLKSAIVQMLLWLAFFSIDAQAEINNAGVLDNVLARYAAAASAWAGVITARASFLFWTLAVISMVWTFGMLALRRASMPKVQTIEITASVQNRKLARAVMTPD